MFLVYIHCLLWISTGTIFPSYRQIILKDKNQDDYLLEISASSSSERTIYFQPLAQSRRSHKLHLRNFRQQSRPSILIKEHLGVELLPIGWYQRRSREEAIRLPHLSLGPLLLLALSAGQGSSELLLLGLLLNLRPHGLLGRSDGEMVNDQDSEQAGGEALGLDR